MSDDQIHEADAAAADGNEEGEEESYSLNDEIRHKCDLYEFMTLYGKILYPIY